jgi:type I restriction enzyme S subunit
MPKNENRPGYKKTKVGWIPLGWKSPAIGDVLKLSRYGCNVQTTKDGNILVVGMKNLQNGEIQLTDLVRVALSKEEQQKFMLKRDDVLINRTNSYDLVGKVGIFDSDDEVAFVSYLVLLRGNQDYIRQKYLNYWLNSYPSQKSIKRIATKGVSQANINPTEFKKHCDIPLPPLPEQRAIAGVLECWDKAIRNYEKKIEKKRNIKKGLMQRLLSGKQRLKGFSGEWKDVELRKVLKEHKETSSGKEEVHSVSVHKGIVNQVDHLGRSFAAKDTSSYNLVKSGDIVYTKSPTGDFPYGIIKQSRLSKNVIVSPLYGVFTPITFHLGLILDCYFESPVNTGNYLRPIIQKGAKNTINISNMTFLSNRLKLPIQKEEQRAVALVFSYADSEIVALEGKLALLKDQKKFLLNNLVTGTIRLPQFRGGTIDTGADGDHA